MGGRDIPTAVAVDPSLSKAMRPQRALFLVDLGLIPAHVIWAWQAAGHQIVEIWICGKPSRGAWKRDRRLGWFAPHWSLSATISQYAIPAREIDNIKANSDAARAMATSDLDVIISVHFMHILSAELLAKLSKPVLNLHPALLPAYRGPSPLVAMLVDETTDQYGGVTLHEIVPAIDAGAIFAAQAVPLPANRNFRAWEIHLARAAARLAAEAIPDVLAGHLKGVPQREEEASYRRPTTKEIAITSQMTSAHVAWLCSTLGKVVPLSTVADGREYPVTGIVRNLGLPTKRPPRVGYWTIDLDLMDQRVRLRRKPNWEGRRRRIETWLMRVVSPP